MMRLKALMFGAVAAIAAGSYSDVAQAKYTITATETPSGVTFDGSGTFDISGLDRSGFFELEPAIIPYSGAFLTGSEGDLYDGLTGPSFGPGDKTSTEFSDGSSILIDPFDSLFGVDYGYVSGSFLTSHTEFAGATFGTLGVTPGTYTYHLGSNSTGDTVTLQIGRAVSAAPEPAAWALMVLGVGIAGFALRRRHRTTIRYV